MRKFSRWMPPEPKRGSILALFILIPVLVPLLPFIIYGHFAIRRQMRKLANERQAEDIESFARASNRRSEPFDPWIVRATWEAFAFYTTVDGKPVPLRPEDDFVEDLCIDPDDIFFSLLPEVTARSGHSLICPDGNTHYGPVTTDGDFVRFITLHPCLREGRCRRSTG